MRGKRGDSGTLDKRMFTRNWKWKRYKDLAFDPKWRRMDEENHQDKGEEEIEEEKK